MHGAVMVIMSEGITSTLRYCILRRLLARLTVSSRFHVPDTQLEQEI